MLTHSCSFEGFVESSGLLFRVEMCLVNLFVLFSELLIQCILNWLLFVIGRTVGVGQSSESGLASSASNSPVDKDYVLIVLHVILSYF